jgi:hypothetical protein
MCKKNCIFKLDSGENLYSSLKCWEVKNEKAQKTGHR